MSRRKYLEKKNIDCYSVGVLFHYLLTGRIPSTGNPSYYLEEKGVSQETINIIIKSISPPNQRYQDGVEMLDALNVIITA